MTPKLVLRDKFKPYKAKLRLRFHLACLWFPFGFHLVAFGFPWQGGSVASQLAEGWRFGVVVWGFEPLACVEGKWDPPPFRHQTV